MTRFVHLNGHLVKSEDARISVFDRAVMFADSVYEGFGILDGDIVDFVGHFERLLRSLSEIGIEWSMSRDVLYHKLRDLITANRVEEGFLYLQISRGVEDRDYVPQAGLTPTAIAYTQPVHPSRASRLPASRKLKSVPDLRWARRDIKSTNLLGQVMAKRAALEEGAQEALLVSSGGIITEGGASSFFAILDQTLIVRPISDDILNGITRQKILHLAKAQGLAIEERIMSLKEAYRVDEAFITAASLNVCPVVKIDDHLIADGRPGDITRQLHQAYVAHARKTFYQPEGI